MVSSAKAINQEMQTFLDKHEKKRRPISLDDYDWDNIRPNNISQSLIDSLFFVTLVESDTHAYAQKLLEAADKYNAPYLRRFIDRTWVPEEDMHHVPLREYLAHAGLEPKEVIDAAIAKVRSIDFTHGEGYTELRASSYGWMQEHATFRFYQVMPNSLRTDEKQYKDPVLVKILLDIGKQENFHRAFYLLAVRTILNHEPERWREVARTAAEFQMPGHIVTPEQQAKATGWAMEFGLDPKSVKSDYIEELVKLIGYRGLGYSAILYGIRNLPRHLKSPIRGITNPITKIHPINYLVGRTLAKTYG